MFHVGGLSSLLTHFLTGGKIVMTEGRFDAGQILALIERERIQVWGAVPTMAIRLLAHPDFASFDLSQPEVVAAGRRARHHRPARPDPRPSCRSCASAD